MDTIQNVDEIRESSRQVERKRLEDDLNCLQREWVKRRRRRRTLQGIGSTDERN